VPRVVRHCGGRILAEAAAHAVRAIGLTYASGKATYYRWAAPDFAAPRVPGARRSPSPDHIDILYFVHHRRRLQIC
jgi:hypothetical protein